MLVNGQSCRGDLREHHRGRKIFWATGNSSLACGIKSFDVVDELFLFDITREPQSVVGGSVLNDTSRRVRLTLHDWRGRHRQCNLAPDL